MRFITTVLAWAWMILIGVLLITPGGVFCIACGQTPSVAGYVGNPVVWLLGIVSIVIGILGLTTMKSLSAGRG